MLTYIEQTYINFTRNRGCRVRKLSLPKLAESKVGTLIPMQLVTRSDLTCNSQNNFARLRGIAFSLLTTHYRIIFLGLLHDKG